MTRLSLLTFLLIAAVVPLGCLEDNPNKDVVRLDTGFLRLDGGGPMSKVDMPPPQPDNGGQPPGKTTRGKFCHNVTYKGQKISLSMKMGSATMSTSTGDCSRCEDIPVGSQTLRLYSGGQYLGAASTVVKEGFHYAYLAKMSSGGRISLSKDELDTKKGESCDKHKPKL